ncbi:MAG: hypothetical protein J6X45_03720, partial [Lachnospiraceae bacterium]|nr:hypothetical protein [Lachnospiraceae bacterium]
MASSDELLDELNTSDVADIVNGNDADVFIDSLKDNDVMDLQSILLDDEPETEEAVAEDPTVEEVVEEPAVEEEGTGIPEDLLTNLNFDTAEGVEEVTEEPSVEPAVEEVVEEPAVEEVVEPAVEEVIEEPVVEEVVEEDGTGIPEDLLTNLNFDGVVEDGTSGLSDELVFESLEGNKTSDVEEIIDMADADAKLPEDILLSSDTEEVVDMDEIDAILSDVSDIHPERTKSAEELEEQIARYEADPEGVEEELLAKAEADEGSSEDGINFESLDADEAIAAGAGLNQEEPAVEEVEEIEKVENFENIEDIENIEGVENVEDIENAEEAADDEEIADIPESDMEPAISDDFLSSLENVDEMLAEVENKANEETEKIAKERESSDNKDEDINEINDILVKSDNNEAINDDLISMIENINQEEEVGGMFDEDIKRPIPDDAAAENAEASEEEDGKKKKKEKKKKEKKKKGK